MHKNARSFLTGLGLTLLVPAWAVAELRPSSGSASGTFDIAEEISFGLQVDPGGGAFDLTRSQITVAAVPGGFAVAWAEEQLLQPEVTGSTVRGQLVKLDGTLGARFSASQPDVPGTVRRVSCPSVASLSGGRFALAWAQDQAAGRDLWLQRFSPQAVADGEPAAHFVAAASLHDQPWVTGSPNGRSALAWLETRAGAGGKVETIYRAQAFAADGRPATPEIELAMVPRQSTLRPAVAVDLAGRFTAVWLVPNGATPTSALWTQSFRADGTPLRPAERLGRSAVDGVAVVRRGSQVTVVWAQRTAAGTRLMGSTLGLDGRPRGNARPIIDGITDGLTGFASPTLLAAPAGDFVLAWLDGDRLRALQLGADLAPKGAVVEVGGARPDLPLVRGQGVGAALAGSRLLLAWPGEMPGGLCPGNAVRGQMFDLAP
jgi:hypothetical protein